MISIFSNQAAIHCPIKLPHMAKAKVTPLRIERMLRDNISIYGWYTLDKFSISALESFTDNRIEGLFVFRKECDFLMTYRAFFTESGTILELYEVSKFSSDDVSSLVSGKLRDANVVLYDKKGVTEELELLTPNLTDQMILDHLKDRSTWALMESDFFS